MNSVCDQVTGDCPCRPNIEGSSCDRCVDNYFGLEEGNCQGNWFDKAKYNNGCFFKADVFRVTAYRYPIQIQ